MKFKDINIIKNRLDFYTQKLNSFTKDEYIYIFIKIKIEDNVSIK